MTKKNNEYDGGWIVSDKDDADEDSESEDVGDKDLGDEDDDEGYNGDQYDADKARVEMKTYCTNLIKTVLTILRHNWARL